MKVNRKGDRTPFDMRRKPCAQRWYLMPIIWGLSWLQMRRFRLKIERVNMKKIKPPYLVLAMHQGESDYRIAPLALFPNRVNYVSDMEGFAAYGERLYRAIGCIGKRRYVPEASVICNVRYALKKGHPVVIYPESRHSNVCTTALLPTNLGRLARRMGVPLVILSVHGCYLANPFWDERHTRKVPIQARLECIYTAEELCHADEKEIQKRIEEKLQYDEYDWQKQKGILIPEEKRAEGLHKALYQCRTCKAEFCMETNGIILCCKRCRSEWTLEENGQLYSASGNVHIPDWYEWQRQNVHAEIDAGTYFPEFSVYVEALPNAKGFIPLGKGTLSCTEKEFLLTICGQTFRFPHVSRESVQTEYDYKGRGMCIVLSHRDCCYYIYSDDEQFNPTKLQFAGEYFHDLCNMC